MPADPGAAGDTTAPAEYTMGSRIRDGGTPVAREATNLRHKVLAPSSALKSDTMAESKEAPVIGAHGETAVAYPAQWAHYDAPARVRYVGQAEADLIRACTAGDHAAWETLISRYQTRVYNVTYHMTQDHDRAADLAQEAFIQILKSLPRFRGEASLSTWIHGLTMRVCLHHMRRERRRQMESWEDAIAGRTEPETTDGKPHETVSRTQLQRAVRNAITKLPLKFRSVMVLHGLAGMTYEETAAALDLPLNTVKTRVHRAKAKLKTGLKDTLGEDGSGV